MRQFICILFLAFTFTGNAQSNAAPSLAGTKVTFLGLDFTQAR